jgi:hypothetical protein
VRHQLTASRKGGEGATISGFNSSTAGMIRYYLSNSASKTASS